jgi:NADH-quinone oxidoreductase subunit J
VAVITALGTILARNPVHSGFMLVLSFLGIAGLFVLLGAEFLAVAQVIIYGGAILVLVVFVVMLVRMDDLPEMHAGHPVQRVVAPIVGLAAFLEVVAAVASGFPRATLGPWTPQVIQAVGGHAQAFGRVLYTDYLFPFIVVSLVLVVAAVGAIVLAKPSRTEEVEALGTISLGQARARTGLERLEALARARGGGDDPAALANAALEQTPALREGRER